MDNYDCPQPPKRSIRDSISMHIGTRIALLAAIVLSCAVTYDATSKQVANILGNKAQKAVETTTSNVKPGWIELRKEVEGQDVRSCDCPVKTGDVDTRGIGKLPILALRARSVSLSLVIGALSGVFMCLFYVNGEHLAAILLI